MTLINTALHICITWFSLLLLQLLVSVRATSEAFQVEPRIVGGIAARPGQYPFYVSWGGCGASLIYPDVILSAAHCNVQAISNVCVSAYNRSDCNVGGGVPRQIVGRVPHPKYDSSNARYDFLVMKLDRAVLPTPIPLNSNPDYPVANQELTVIGLGINATNGTRYQTLQQVTLPYNDPAVCYSVYGSIIDDTVQFCAGGLPQGGKDSCQGDSGGPIFDNNRVLVGVVSTGDACALPNIPGIYSRVSGAIDWINQQVCALSATPPSSCNGSPPTQVVPPPLPAPTRPTATARPPSAGPATVRVRIDVKYDNRPAENSWSIRNNSGIVFYRSPFGAGSAGKGVTTYVKLIPGTYMFYIRDTAGNGICCQNGNGNYAVYLPAANNRIRKVARSNGVFTYFQRRSFRVPSSTAAVARSTLRRQEEEEEEVDDDDDELLP